MRLFHTVRHLRPVQIVGRVTARLERGRPEIAPAPPLRPRPGPSVRPPTRAPSLLGRWRVRFLNQDGEIAHPAQWNDPARPKLWLYNLHYFDDLSAAGAEGRRDLHGALIERWVAENPPGTGNGWEPYPVSLRAVNWIKWALGGATLAPRWADSLAVQIRWLARRVEWHLLGNHVLANAKALVFAGLFFAGEEAERWLAQGLSIYERQLPEQILADGGHFELSPMYHAIILEDLLDLVNLARSTGHADGRVFAGLPEIIGRMRVWLAVMTHPDGGPSFFNDAAFGIAPSRADLDRYADRLGLPAIAEPGDGVHHLASSGYVRVNDQDMAAILDVAPIGPDYIPGHAHADTLSFELSLGTERIIVNGGTSTYAPGPLREAQRATAAHSTVEVEGENSSEVWASFRVARRARIRELGIDRSPDGVRVSASHDGYRRLVGAPVCRRTWTFRNRALAVSDEVSRTRATAAVARFFLGPGVTITTGQDRSSGTIASERGRRLGWALDAQGRIEAATWYPTFGTARPITFLAAPLVAGRLTATFDWP